MEQAAVASGERINAGSNTAVPRCVSSVKLLNLSGLAVPHLRGPVTGSSGGLGGGDCHNSRFKVSPWGPLVFFPGHIWCLSFPMTPRWPCGMVFGYKGPQGDSAAAVAAAGGMTLSKSSPLGPDFLTYETGAPTLPPASVEHHGAPPPPCLPASLGCHHPTESQRDRRKHGQGLHSRTPAWGVSRAGYGLRHVL